MNINEEVDDLRRPDNDHDLLVRLHERLMALTQQMQSFINSTANNYTELKSVINQLGVRIDALERQGAVNNGEKSVNTWIRTAVTAMFTGIVVGVTLYFVNKFGQ